MVWVAHTRIAREWTEVTAAVRYVCRAGTARCDDAASTNARPFTFTRRTFGLLCVGVGVPSTLRVNIRLAARLVTPWRARVVARTTGFATPHALKRRAIVRAFAHTFK